MAWTPERKAQFAKDMAARRAAKKEQTQQTQTPQTKVEEQIKTDPQIQQDVAAPQLLTFTPEQLKQLVDALSGGTRDSAPAQAFQPTGQQVNSQGQVIGSIEKFPIDPDYYPDPIEDILKWLDANPRTRRFAFRDNYYLTWEMTSVPYDTKFGTSVREPTFHLTLYSPLYDEDGEDTGRFRVIQSLHFNEDESTALGIAAEMGFQANAGNMREVMNQARIERIKRWLLSVFFPERNFDLNTFYDEEAIDGQVVRVITKSNVKGFGNKTPKIEFEELQ